MVLTVDHITGATGKTPTVTIAKNNAGFTSPAGTISEVGNGIYQIAANATDADTLGPLWIHATATGTDPCDDQFDVVDYDPRFARITTFAPVAITGVSAMHLITRAFDDIGVRTQGEPLASADALDAFARLNTMMGQWQTQSLTVPFVAREVFDLVADQATYTIGPGGDFDTARPQDIMGAGLLLNSSTPPVEIPRAVITDEMYAAIQIKTMTNPLFTSVYYNTTYASGWGEITLWPVPSTAEHQLVLYRLQQVGYFDNLTDLYDFPPGYAEALEYNLARRLLTPYAVSDAMVISGVLDMAKSSLANIKRANVKLSDLSQDPAITRTRRGGYNILTGS